GARLTCPRERRRNAPATISPPPRARSFSAPTPTAAGTGGCSAPCTGSISPSFGSARSGTSSSSSSCWAERRSPRPAPISRSIASAPTSQASGAGAAARRFGATAPLPPLRRMRGRDYPVRPDASVGAAWFDFIATLAYARRHIEQGAGLHIHGAFRRHCRPQLGLSITQGCVREQARSYLSTL